LESKQGHLPIEETTTNTPMLLQGQLVATKFLVPVASHPLIPRPRLDAFLQHSLKYALTLVSAPAGSGKTTSLAAWGQSLPPSDPLLAWVSLDEGDNDSRLFWTYVISAVNRQCPGRFTSLLNDLQSPQDLSLKYILRSLINLLADKTERFVLILDDYHVITQPEIHTALLYLVEHLPLQLRIILATRAEPSLPLVLLQARQQVLKVCTEQLRCTDEETKAFFHQIVGLEISDELAQQVRHRTEGWLVGLQLLSLSISNHTDPHTLLEEISGDQRYILDYLTEEVLRRQPPDVQMFLLSTCILEHLTAPLCNAVTQQENSQHILEQLEQANVFVTSVDTRRQWYRYHALFAEALSYQLEHTHSDLVAILHHRASLWYSKHGYTIEAILHAFHAQQWPLAADLIENSPLMALALGASECQVNMLRQWLAQLPIDLIRARPRLCLTCAQILWASAPQATLVAWLDAAESMLTAALTSQTNQALQLTFDSKEQQEQADLLGEVLAFRAVLKSHQAEGQVALPLCQQALPLLSANNFVAHAQVSIAQLQAAYLSSINDAAVAIQHGLQAGSLAQAAGQTRLAVTLQEITAMYMLGAGRLHEAQRLSQQALLLATQLEEVSPWSGCPALFQAEILREWNQLDAARALAEEAIRQCQQHISIASPAFLLYGYAVLMRILLSCGDYDATHAALQKFERLGRSVNQPTFLHMRSLFTTVDQVRLWLVCGELIRASRWVEWLEIEELHATAFAHERAEVARARVLLAKAQPVLALERLEPVLVRATAAQRWGHVIETRLLQALAYQMHQQETSALSALSEAVRLAEPENYICCFVDEGPAMVSLLSRLRQEQHKTGPTPYLDTLLAAFPHSAIDATQSQRVVASKVLPGIPMRGKHATNAPRLKQIIKHTTSQPLLDPLSDRELEVLQLLASGESNQEIAQELTIVVDTVKRHVSQIFAKLTVKNRVQAVRRAQELGLLDEKA
jgi:LuxR family transcriptional regulator, maltose regulon positive regulatory protein